MADDVKIGAVKSRKRIEETFARAYLALASESRIKSTESWAKKETVKAGELLDSAIKNLEKSFVENRPRALIQMATGSGKTFTAITSIYRLLKHAKAKRILFLVDTRNLGEQAQQEFMNYSPVDDYRNFTELYNVHRLNSRYISEDSQVCISTIQRMYSILKGQDLDESTEEAPLFEIKMTKPMEEVIYNDKYPPEFFDFIVI